VQTVLQGREFSFCQTPTSGCLGGYYGPYYIKQLRVCTSPQWRIARYALCHLNRGYEAIEATVSTMALVKVLTSSVHIV
jgi:hypothetical protein